MPILSVKLSKSAKSFIYSIKFKTGIDENKIIYLMIKYFKNHPQELKKIMEYDNVFDKRTNEIMEELKNDSRILQNKY